MKRALLALLAFAPACSTSGSEVEELPLEDSVRVVVVDEQGAPVPGAEVRGPGRAGVEMSATEAIFSGRLGLIDRYAKPVRADDEASARVGDPRDEHWVVASEGGRWGAVHGARAAGSDDVVVTLRRDEVQRVRCVDTDGRPAQGALVWIWTKGESTPVEWGQFVTAADGTLDVPHAQHWRALRGAGRDVRIGGLVMWGEAMLSNLGDVPFPDAGGVLEFVVEPSGWIDVRAEESARGVAMLRWLDSPPDPENPDDEDDVPEMPFDVDRAPRMSVPLGLRLELVVQIPGGVDPRVTFDGPRTAGQRVEVVVPAPKPAFRCTGRLVDAAGQPIVRRSFEAWIEREGVRVEPEDDWLASDERGDFAFDFAAATSGTLHFDVANASDGFPVADRVVLGGPATYSSPPSRLLARRELSAPSTTALFLLGDVVCTMQP